MDTNTAIQTAFDHYRTGNLQKSESIFREILKIQPNNADAIHFLGLIYFQLKDYDAAIEYIKQALRLKPYFADAHNNLGIIYQNRGQYNEAIDHYQKALQIKPDFVNSYYNMGTALQAKGQIDEAFDCYRKVIERTPHIAGAYYYSGVILQSKGRTEEALVYFQKAVELDPNLSGAYYMMAIIFQGKCRIDEAIISYHKAIESNPDNVDAYNNLGVAFQSKEQFDKALECFHNAIALNPGHAQAFNNLGNTFKELGEWNKAIESYKHAIKIKPTYTLAYYNLGNILGFQGRWEEAVAFYNKALENDPDFVTARWARCMSRLHFIYADQKNIQISRKQYYDELLKLHEAIILDTEKSIDEAAAAVGSNQPFLLACQGLCDRDLQQLYGGLVCRIMERKYPGCTKNYLHTGVLKKEPIRIGIVSAYFHLHSVWKIPMRGWLENFDKGKFQIYGYHTGRTKDSFTDVARKQCYRFFEDIYSFEELSRIIRNDNLDVIIYPEIGMDPMTSRLAALRLAPVQCVSWGHPDTSGMPTIDYYISSDLMEPPGADDHYTETLIRLPNLSVCYTPLDMKPAPINRAKFNLRQNSILYLCSQSLFKYLPQYDEIFPRISQLVGDCQFLFISEISSYVTEEFRLRIKTAFDYFGLKADDHIVFLPRLQPERYLGVNMLSDVFLDSLDWSGCNSTLEAIGCNLPVVTLPGRLMRGRHSMAILTMMGVTETIATSIDEYIDIAVRLGKDAAWRRKTSEKIETSKHRLYYDKTPIDALGEFLKKVIKEKLYENKLH